MTVLPPKFIMLRRLTIQHNLAVEAEPFLLDSNTILAATAGYTESCSPLIREHSAMALNRSTRIVLQAAQHSRIEVDEIFVVETPAEILSLVREVDE